MIDVKLNVPTEEIKKYEEKFKTIFEKAVRLLREQGKDDKAIDKIIKKDIATNTGFFGGFAEWVEETFYPEGVPLYQMKPYVPTLPMCEGCRKSSQIIATFDIWNDLGRFPETFKKPLKCKRAKDDRPCCELVETDFLLRKGKLERKTITL